MVEDRPSRSPICISRQSIWASICRIVNRLPVLPIASIIGIGTESSPPITMGVIPLPARVAVAAAIAARLLAKSVSL